MRASEQGTRLSAIRSALITGIGGSGGSYLAEYIVEHHPEVRVHGFARWHSTTEDNLQALRGKVTLHEVDLNDEAGCHLPPGGARQRARVLHYAAGGAVEQHPRHRKSVRSGAPREARPADSALQHLRGVRAGGSEGRADSRGGADAAGESLRRVEGGAGSARLYVLRRLQDAHHPHADVCLSESTAHRSLRHFIRAPGGAHRGRAAEGAHARQPRVGAHDRRCARRHARILGRAAALQTGRGL